MVKWITILLCVLGMSVAVYAIATEGRSDQKPPPPASPPAVNPFAHGIAGAGVVEAASRNVPVAAPEGGVVAEVFAKVGQKVHKGDRLFQLDTRLLEADLIRATAAKITAAAKVARLRALPRAEELPPLEAAVERARVRLADANDILNDTMTAAASKAVSQMEVQRRTFATQVARAELSQAEAVLNLAKAGAWSPEVTVAEAELAASDADIRAIQLRLSRLTIVAPVDGTILKSNIEPGQYAAPAGAGGSAAMILGDIDTLRIRARIDEEDAPLLRDHAAGVARIRGIAAEDVKLKWMWVEPLAQPKIELTGSTLERVDTRVVEVLFEITQKPRARLFPGQMVDVFIDAAAPGAAP